MKSQIVQELLRKRDVLIKSINREGVIIPSRHELPCEFFVAMALSGEILFQLISIFRLYSSVVVLVVIEIILWT